MINNGIQVSEPVLAKPYQLSFELRSKYLYVLIKGDKIDLDIAREYWEEIKEIREKANTRLVLVDKDVRAELSTADEFKLAGEMATMAFKRVKLAMCDRHVSLENLAFAELVATNRGLNTKSFRDAKSAERWLLAA
jgi:hypothetical protein